MVLAVDAYSVAERARELCYQTSVLHDLVGELRATAEIACQQAHAARHEARERRQVVKCHRYLRRSADRPAVVLPARVASTPGMARQGKRTLPLPCRQRREGQARRQDRLLR